jgi:lysozyme
MVIGAQSSADTARPDAGRRQPAGRRPRGRRRLGLVLVCCLLVAALAVVGWFVAVPFYRPPLQAGEHYGIDVSNHQGAVDWPAVAGDGITAAYIKATEGETFVDGRFADNWGGAGRQLPPRGAPRP